MFGKKRPKSTKIDPSRLPKQRTPSIFTENIDCASPVVPEHEISTTNQPAKLKTKRKSEMVNDAVKKMLIGIKQLVLHRKSNQSMSRGGSVIEVPIPIVTANPFLPNITVPPQILINNSQAMPSETNYTADHEARSLKIKENSRFLDYEFEKQVKKFEALNRVGIDVVPSMVISQPVLGALVELRGLIQAANSMENECQKAQLPAKQSSDDSFKKPLESPRDSFIIDPNSHHYHNVSPVPVLPLRRNSELYLKSLDSIVIQPQQQIPFSAPQSPNALSFAQEFDSSSNHPRNQVYLENYKLSIESLKAVGTLEKYGQTEGHEPLDDNPMLDVAALFSLYSECQSSQQTDGAETKKESKVAKIIEMFESGKITPTKNDQRSLSDLVGHGSSNGSFQNLSFLFGQN